MSGGEASGGDFGALLRRHRSAAGLTQEELSDLSGLSVRAIADIERGRTTRPYRGSVRLLVDALALSGPERDQLVQAARRQAADSGMTPGQAMHRRVGGEPVVVPRQLPARGPHFVARADELKVLSSLLNTAAGPGGTVMISAITGTAGIGKTALAVHFGHLVAERFPDGHLFVGLRGFDPKAEPMTPAEAVRGFLVALGVPGEHIPVELDARASLYRSLLAAKRMLIVLDNAADTAQVRPLLPGHPGCLVIVTSRRQLTGLVTVEGAVPITLDMLADAEALELFASRLGTERMAAEPEAAGELIRLCARLPLALAITAARAAVNPGFRLQALVGELGDAQGRLDALDAGEAAADVRTVFSWSCQHLSEASARMFRLLGVHCGPDIAAHTAASLAGLPLPQARQALAGLTAAGLLMEHLPGRYTFHDLLRAYAAEQASTTDSHSERRAAMLRILDHYLHTAHAASRLLSPARDPLVALIPPSPGVLPEHFGEHSQALAWFDAEHQGLLAAIALAASAGFDTHALQIPLPLEEFFERRGYWDNYAATQQTALAAAERLADKAGQAHASRNLGHACALLGAYDDSRVHNWHSLELYRQLGDEGGQARTHFGLAYVLHHQGHDGDALHHALQGLDLYRAAGHRAGEAHALNNVGYYNAGLGNYQLAITYCRQGLAIHQELGNRSGEAAIWDSLGYAHRGLREYGKAIACYQQSVRILRELGHRYNQALALRHLGDSCRDVGQPEAARHAWQQALAILDDLHHPDAGQVGAQLDDLDAGTRGRSEVVEGQVPAVDLRGQDDLPVPLSY